MIRFIPISLLHLWINTYFHSGSRTLRISIALSVEPIQCMKLVVWLTVVINSNNTAHSSYVSLQGSWNLNIQRWLKHFTQPSVTDPNCCIPPDTRYASMAVFASGKWIRVELVNNIPLKSSGTMSGGGFLKNCGLLVQQTRCRWVQMIRPLNSHNTTMRLTISAVFSRQRPHSHS